MLYRAAKGASTERVGCVEDVDAEENEEEEEGEERGEDDSAMNAEEEEEGVEDDKEAEEDEEEYKAFSLELSMLVLLLLWILPVWWLLSTCSLRPLACCSQYTLYASISLLVDRKPLPLDTAM